LQRIPFLTVLALCALAALGGTAHAQYRTTTQRGRLELAFDHGYGFSTEGDFLELGSDIRAYAPEGIGGAIRVGVAAQGLSNAFAADLGVALRTDLVATPRWGLQLAGAIGPSLAVGPFDGGRVMALGGFGMVHLDLWVGVLFVGIGVTGHALWSERHASPNGRADAVLSIAPTLRVGFDWGI
jgi:hypothetical protein